MERSIIHLNVADFAVAVERIIDPGLKDYPVVIAPKGAARAVVYDMSEEAYRAGIRKSMSLRRALRLCRDIRVLPPHQDRYERAMGDLVRRALPYSPQVEPGEGDGHLFVDVTGTSRLFGPSVDVAWRLNKRIKSDLGLDPVWSLAANKLVAKVATRIVKPTGEYIVGSGEEKKFLAPLPVSLLPGIERGDLIRLREFNFSRISQVLAMNIEHLQMPFGNRAMFIYETVRGIDRSPVLAIGDSKPCVRAEHEFADDTNDAPVLKQALYSLVEQVCTDLRKRRMAAGKMCIVLSYSDGLRSSARMTLKPATANDIGLFEKMTGLLDRAWKRRVRIRHMRLICEKLMFPQVQMELFREERETEKRRADIVNAMAGIRTRFGFGAIKPAMAV